MIRFWLTAGSSAALGMEELPERARKVPWGAGPPPGGKGWHLRQVRELASERVHVLLWEASPAAVTWLYGEAIRRRLAAQRPPALVEEDRHLGRAVEVLSGALSRLGRDLRVGGP